MNSIRNWLVNILKNLVNWLNRQELSSSTQNNERVQRELLADEIAKEESRPAPRLRSGQVGIFVHCASCGIVHELEAVCHKCGAPLCSDKYNCRIIKTDPEMGISAIYCPTCAHT